MLGLLPLHRRQIINESKNREVQDGWECVVCGVTSGIHQALALGAEVPIRQVNLGTEWEVGSYALSPLSVSDLKEAVNLSSNVAPFFYARK